MISIIVAMDKNNLIGSNNDIPWHFPEDLKHFKKTTHGKPVIMGRNTWLSLPKKPLPDRRNIIVSSSKETISGAEIAPSLSEAIEIAEKVDKDVFIIGGQMLYDEAIHIANQLIITHIKDDFEGDRYFPQIGEEWEGVSELDTPEFEIIVYHRRQGLTLLK